MGVPRKWIVYNGKFQSKMDDDWGYPHFRKPPYIHDLDDERHGTTMA